MEINYYLVPGKFWDTLGAGLDAGGVRLYGKGVRLYGRGAQVYDAIIFYLQCPFNWTNIYTGTVL